MKIFIACLGTETNTFSSLPTGLAAFADIMLRRGDGSVRGTHASSMSLGVWRHMAEERGIEVAEGLSAFAEPAGVTTRIAYETFRDEILDGVRNAMPTDAVLLALHGAMIAEGYLDAEGDLLERIRSLVGSRVKVGVVLDSHVQLSPLKVAQADVLVIFKEYPHSDIRERAREVFDITLRAAAGEIRPVMATADCHINMYLPTTREPMAGFVRRMREAERQEGVLSVSLAHGFPHGDSPHCGARTLVIADGDADCAARLAEALARDLWAVREGLRVPYMTMTDALDVACAEPEGPVVIGDVADNAGGGAPSDATFFLRCLLDREVQHATVATIWDPTAVRFCMDAGEGGRLRLRVGGKCGPESGDPVDLPVTVMKIVKEARQTFFNFSTPMGEAVWVTSQGINLILNNKRFQTAHPDMISQFGLDPLSQRIIVVKSAQHFHGGFAPIARKLLYAVASGAANPDTSAIHYVNYSAPFWPRDAEAFASGHGRQDGTGG
jgi:microcystin degradation protein MlrC